MHAIERLDRRGGESLEPLDERIGPDHGAVVFRVERVGDVGETRRARQELRGELPHPIVDPLEVLPSPRVELMNVEVRPRVVPRPAHVASLPARLDLRRLRRELRRQVRPELAARGVGVLGRGAQSVRVARPPDERLGEPLVAARRVERGLLGDADKVAPRRQLAPCGHRLEPVAPGRQGVAYAGEPRTHVVQVVLR